MSKERLVVIGNGMAGARFVDDLFGRGGGDRFDVAMFGDEPCGNYNRILLSSVLSRSHKPDDIFINPHVVVRVKRHHASRRHACRAD